MSRRFDPYWKVHLRRRPPEANPPPPEGWGVRTISAERRLNNYYDFYDDQKYTTKKIADKVAVRLTYNSLDRMTFGIVSITDEEFEDKITTLQAAAQDRASALNAVGASG